MRPNISSQEYQRLVRLLGGSERILIHPLQAGRARAIVDRGGGGAQSVLDDFVGMARAITGTGAPVDKASSGLFSFFTFDPNTRPTIGGVPQQENTLAFRQYYASCCLGHFPRFITGGYDLLHDSEDTRRRIANASAAIVLLCERVVKEMQPLGNVADEYVTSANIIAAGGQAREFSDTTNRLAFMGPRAGGRSGRGYLE